MANVIVTPNMNLPNPVPGQDPGPDYADQLQASLKLVDQHNHTSGQGVPITPAAININADLSLNSNNATSLRSARFTPQPTAISGAADIGCIYVSGVDLYYNDENGNQVQITSGGVVNATSSGISSGTNTASFVSNVLVVNRAAATPANIQAGSILIGNNVSSSKFVTLEAPAALGSNYALILPGQAPGGTTQVMTINDSGAMSSITYDAVGQDMSSTGADAIANTRTRATGLNVPVGGVANNYDPTSGNIFTTTSTTPVTVDFMSVNIVTAGRPVQIMLTGAPPSLGGSYISLATGGSSVQAFGYFYRGSTQLCIFPVEIFNTSQVLIPPGMFSFVDIVGAGSYSYTFQVSVNSGTTLRTHQTQLIAYEL